MIYNNSYFRKELRQTYIKSHISTIRKVIFGAFLGLITIAFHFLLLTLDDSMFSSIFPNLLEKTFFTTTFIYISVFFIIYIIYFLIQFDHLSFAELQQNHWYLLVKMKYNPRKLYFTKISAMFFSLFWIYTIGFFVTLLLSWFLQYPYDETYLIALYLIGILDIAVISVIGTTFSLFTTKVRLARILILISAVFIYVLRIGTGYRDIVTSSTLLQKEGIIAAFNFFNSPYFFLSCLIMICCLITSYYRAKNFAQYYILPSTNDYTLSNDDIGIARYDERTKKFYFLNDIKKVKLKTRIYDILMKSFLVFIALFAITANIIIIFISNPTPGNEIVLNGKIPYFCTTDKMRSQLFEDDLAFFSPIDENTKIKESKMVLFKKDNSFDCKWVNEINDNSYIVSYDNKDEIQTIDKTQIIGLYSHRSRFLSIIIAILRSIFGKIMFVFIPIAIFVFYKTIKNYLNYSLKTSSSS